MGNIDIIAINLSALGARFEDPEVAHLLQPYGIRWPMKMNKRIDRALSLLMDTPTLSGPINILAGILFGFPLADVLAFRPTELWNNWETISAQLECETKLQVTPLWQPATF